MEVYSALLAEVLHEGAARADRTGVGTRSLFGRHLRLSLRETFPLLTGKRLHVKSIVHELLWFLRGETNVKSLQAAGVRIWDEWADAEGNLGPVYGKQWRSWSAPDGRTVDQLARVLETLRRDPHSRRLLVSAWNPAEVGDMALPPCHVLFQFYVQDGRLSCQVYQRSADVFLGVPFNLASYALLTCMIAQACDLQPDALAYTFGDVHLYDNHVEAAREYLARPLRPLPRLRLNPAVHDLFDFTPEDVVFEDYNPHPSIKAPVAV